MLDETQYDQLSTEGKINHVDQLIAGAQARKTAYEADLQVSSSQGQPFPSQFAIQTRIDACGEELRHLANIRDKLVKELGSPAAP